MSEERIDKIIDSIILFLENCGLPTFLTIIIVFILIIGVTKPENFQIYFGYFWKLLAFPFKCLRKKSIKDNIEGPCTKALKKISKELPDLDIPSLSIEWVNKENLETKLKEGTAIIKLKFENDETKNIVRATSIYVRDAFLKNAKPYITESLRKAIDFSVTKKILLNLDKKNPFILPIFMEENVLDNEEVAEKCDQIEEIDDSGLFTRVLLREFDLFGKKLYGRNAKEDFKKEAEEFFSFIDNIATREYDDSTPLAFSEQIIRAGVVLVAKEETYINYGISPYLRRIKLGIAKGIDSFYLLARGASVEILKEVAKELLNSGNFTLINNPKEYFDNRKRPAICYCIRVNEDSIYSNTLKEIGNALKDKSLIAGVVTSVREKTLKIDVNGIEGYIKKENISIIDINNATLYFREGSYIEAVPIEIQENGIVEFSLRNTKSDPNNFLTSQFEIGKRVVGKIKQVEDDFIIVDLGHEKIDGFAYRKDLTYSRFQFLHEIFEINKDFEFDVLGYNFEKGNVRLSLSDLKDPWSNIYYSKYTRVSFLICKKTNKSFVGEIAEGIDAVLPIRETGWTDEEITKAKENYKLNDTLFCLIDYIDKEKRIVLLTLKKKDNNPYIQFLNINKGKNYDLFVQQNNSYGVNGYINDGQKYNIYIPSYEISWTKTKFNFQKTKKYQVQLIGIDKFQTKLIGTMKPFVPHPLADFCNSFKEGQVLKKMRISTVLDHKILYDIKHNNKIYKGVLNRKDIYDGYIQCKDLGLVLDDIPLCILSIDMEKNIINLSLRDLLIKNSDRIQSLSYTKTYKGFILSSEKKNYYVLLKGLWIIGKLEPSKKYSLGEQIDVRPSAMNSELILTDD